MSQLSEDIAGQLTRIQNAKTAIRASIMAKGVVDFPETTKIDGYATKVDQIAQGGGGPILKSAEGSFTIATRTNSINFSFSSADLVGKNLIAYSCWCQECIDDGAAGSFAGGIASNPSLIVDNRSLRYTGGCLAAASSTGTVINSNYQAEITFDKTTGNVIFGYANRYYNQGYTYKWKAYYTD